MIRPEHVYFGSEILTFCAGIGGLWYGLRNLLYKRMVENLPKSSVRAVALGLVETSGQAIAWIPQRSPITKTPCAYYQYKVEKLCRDGNGEKYWRTFLKADSKEIPFLVADDTGRILIYPKGAKCIFETSYSFTWRRGSTFSAATSEFIESIESKFATGNEEFEALRLTEERLDLGQTAYVIGTCKEGLQALAAERCDHLEMLAEVTKEVRLKDVQVLREAIGPPSSSQTAASSAPKGSASDAFCHDCVYIGVGSGRNQVFLISNRGEADFQVLLDVMSQLSIIGGITLILLGIW